MQGINPLTIGTKTKVKNLRTFTDSFVFDYFTHLVDEKSITYEKTQLRVLGKCNVKEGDIVCINEIIVHGWDRFRSKNGYIKYPFLIVDITNLTPPKIEW